MKTSKITYFGITIGAIASAYVSYVLNGVWSKGIDITTFTDTFLFALQHPSRNYYNTNTDKAIVYGLIIYGMAVIMYLTNKRKLMIGKEYGTVSFFLPGSHKWHLLLCFSLFLLFSQEKPDSLQVFPSHEH